MSNQHLTYCCPACQRVKDQDPEHTELGMTVELHAPADLFKLMETGGMIDPLTIGSLVLARPHLPNENGSVKV